MTTILALAVVIPALMGFLAEMIFRFSDASEAVYRVDMDTDTETLGCDGLLEMSSLIQATRTRRADPMAHFARLAARHRRHRVLARTWSTKDPAPRRSSRPRIWISAPRVPMAWRLVVADAMTLMSVAGAYATLLIGIGRVSIGIARI